MLPGVASKQLALPHGVFTQLVITVITEELLLLLVLPPPKTLLPLPLIAPRPKPNGHMPLALSWHPK
jgi:hypothetical protein